MTIDTHVEATGAPSAGPKHPSISVVICTYGRSSPVLRSCLEPLMAQTISKLDYEIIIVDDGNNEPLVQQALPMRIADHGPTIQVIRASHRGLVTARNIGWRAARGWLVAYIDDDCVPSLGWLQALRQSFTDPDTMGAGGPSFPYTASTLVGRYTRKFDNQLQSQLDDGQVDVLLGCNACFRRSLLEEIGGFSEHFSFFEGLGIPTGYDDDEICGRVRAKGYHLRYNAAAFVYHMQRSTLKALLRQWYNYGQGAAGYVSISQMDTRALKPFPVEDGVLRRVRTRSRRAIQIFGQARRTGSSVLEALTFAAIDFLQSRAFLRGFSKGRRSIDEAEASGRVPPPVDPHQVAILLS
ncbi:MULTISPECIES: glycosyltransferase [unclassified Inquilinus]|uniref:glycosyltransferase n=1 Tax=unclassified Inquilinus TaxID=2645927 RepID=UPI003F916B0D